MKRLRILILGGTTEARKLAEKLAGRSGLDVTISLAGRTLDPKPLPVATRTGGFGGAGGLARYMIEHSVDLLVDATHPFANTISANAERAALDTGIAHFALCRPVWTEMPGDRWTIVDNMDLAVKGLGNRPRRVFLAIGRQEACRFAAVPQNFYLIRSVDPVEPPLDVPDCSYLLDTGPFTLERELALLKDHRIDVIVAKNSGGDATYAKIVAARQLGIEVIMVSRARPLDTVTVPTVEAALAEIDHLFAPVK